MNKPLLQPGFHPLSAGQKELWYWQKKEPSSGAYNEGLVLELDNVDVDRLQKAFCLLGVRHPVLRTVYSFRDGQPVAVVTDALPDFKVLEVGAVKTETLYSTINEEYNKAFDLSRSVMRIRLYLRNGKKPLMLAVVHHIACDGWSLKILWNELLNCYVNEHVQPVAVAPCYHDFVEDEAQYLQTGEAKETLAFWKQELDAVNVHASPLIEMEEQGPAQALHFVAKLEPELLEQLRLVAHASGGSLFETLLSIYHLSIFYFTREQNILIGTPFFNRQAGFKQAAGYFVNAIGLRNELNAADSFAGQLAMVHAYLKLARMHSRYSFAAVKENLQHAALQQFQYFFSVRNRLFDISSPEGELKEALGFTYEAVDILLKTEPQFDLHLEVFEASQGGKAVFHYNSALINGEMVNQLSARFEWLCGQVVSRPQISISELMQLPAAEAKAVIAMGRGEEVEYDVASGYSNLFYEQAKLTPGNIAVKDSSKSWTYAQLMQASISVSAHLEGSRPVIAVCMERCCEMTAIVIGIWRSGGIYMPVDASLPRERLSYMLADAGASLLISDKNIEGVSIKQLSVNELFAADIETPACTDNKFNGAYLLYTSGSTGRPKGVLVSAKGMLNHMHSKRDDLQLNESSIVAQTASVSFDVSVWQMFACLLTGGSVRIYSKDEALNMKRHLKQLIEDGVTVTQMVPSYLREFINEAQQNVTTSSLKYLVSAGEELDGALAARWFKCFKDTVIANCYGPTEASDNISIHIFNECNADEKVPSGRALHNMQLYVVDRFGNLCQPGITGEIWVSGTGVSQGYIGSAQERSAEVFMADPFTPERWLYKTGDLGKWENGLLQFRGRKDRQVKLRGQRVELAEIENVLQQFEAIKQAAVVYNAELLAYVVWKEKALPEELASYLRERLPAYMIPANIVTLEKMPLTASGKLDRKQLPAVVGVQQQIAAPTNELEASLLGIFRQVLDKISIGIQHNFFEHGGHSLKAVQLVSQIEQEHGIDLPVSSLFTHPSVAMLAKLMAGFEKHHDQIVKAPVLDLYPASGQQQLVWSVCNSSRQASAAYNMTGAIQFDEVPDRAVLLSTFAQVIQSHECLRTNFTEQDGKLWQVIRENANIEIPVVNVDSLESAVQQHLEAEGQLVFDLEHDLLVRLTLFVSPGGAACLAGTIHHLVADGISLQLILSQLKYGRAALCNELEYKDYCWWQQEWLHSEQSGPARKYLQSVLQEAEALHLPVDHARPLVKSYAGKAIELTIKNESFEKLSAIAGSLQVPLAVPVITAIQLMLEAFTGQEQLTTGMILTGRHRSHWQQQAGLFMNTLPLVINIDGNDTIEKIISRVNAQLSALQDHQAFPYYALLQQQPELAPLFSKVLINYRRLEDLSYAQATTAPSSKAELEFECYEISGAFSCRLIYDASLFSDGTAEQLLRCLETMLTQAISKPGTLVKDIELMIPSAKSTLLQTCSGAKANYPVQDSYSNLFSQSVCLHAANIAVSDGQGSFTYEELDALSSHIAAALQQRLSPQSIVAACISRNLFLPAIVLGIWKAGCIYLPLDPTHPIERNGYILSNANAALIIHENAITSLPEHIPVIPVNEVLTATDQQPAPIEHQQDWLSYIIYTSGSTGKPKGVMVEQRGMLNHIFSRIQRFGLDADSKMAQIASHTFDISMWQLFAPLLAGGHVQIFAAAQVRDPHSLVKLIRSKHITHMQVVPTYLNELLEVLQTTGKKIRYPQLQVVATIGEELKRTIAEKWLQRVPNARLFNTYGPTEASDTITDHEVNEFPCLKIPIGRPVDNLNIYVFDKHGRLCPPAIPGEICVSGIGVGQGYIGLPEKTADVFSTDPFNAKTKMYRTGDAGRWLASGVLEFMGRKDSQVKLFGNRIELSEIEQVILSCAEVKQAAVLVQELSANPLLVAYVVLNNSLYSVNAIRQHLRQQLPVYMIPARFVALDEMPLTSSGKIDRKRLPKPEAAATTGHEAPRNKKEETLCSIWEEVLGRKPVGRQDNFFALGGHSLKATQLLLHIQRRLGCRLEIADIFSHPTVALLAELVHENSAGEFAQIVRVPDAEYYAVSPSQKRIWVLSQLNGANTAYNIAGNWQLPANINLDQLQRALQRVVQRHESLRTGFLLQKEELVQVITPSLHINKFFEHLHSANEAQTASLVEETYNYQFDLADAGLLRIKLIEQQNKYVLVCVLHHIIADGWSVYRLMQEISELYAGNLSQQTSAVQYRDYTAWLNQTLTTESLHTSAKYWSAIAEKAEPLQLVMDHARPAVQSFDGACVELTIDSNKLFQLRGFAQQRNMSMFMMMAAAVKLLLYRYSNQQNITVGGAVAGREHPATHEMIGCFINTILLSTSIHPQSLVLQFLEGVRDTTLSAYAHQAYPFDRLVDELGARDLARNALFDVLINHQVDKLSGTLPLDFYGEPVCKPCRSAKLDLEFTFYESNDALRTEIVFNTGLFEKRTIELYAAQLLTLLDELITASPEKTVKDVVAAISAKEQELVLTGKGLERNYPVQEGYSNLFFKQAVLHGDAIALRDSNSSLTYAELAGKALAVSNILKQEIPAIHPVVAVCLPRCCQLTAIAIAIWQMGGIYMPIDDSLPEERIAYMLDDAGASLIICERELKGIAAKQLNADALLNGAGQERNADAPLSDSTYNGAYLLYTSGSTGRPKGVLVSAAGMLNHLHSKCEDLELNAQSIVAQTAAISFDVSIWQMFACLLAGGSARLYSKDEVLNIKEHLKQLRNDGITVAQMVPSYLRELMVEAENGSSLVPQFQYLLSVGEELDGALANRCLQYFGCKLVNAYGPTEAADNISMHFIAGCGNEEKIAIGKAVQNMQLYVVDSFGNLCQPGIMGEIWVSGIGVSQGYIGNAKERSAEVFMQDPFTKGKWLYKTGDLGKWKDGLLQFCGRKDRQIKLRGQRIELAEIENIVQQFDAVKQAAVVHNAEQGSLAAYVVWKDAALTDKLGAHLLERLPAYMIPASIVTLEKMPLTASGKLDRKRLPSIAGAQLEIAGPTNQLEASLLKIWKQVLNKEDIGIQHNFFEHGGHSLKAIKLIGAVEEQLQATLRLQDIFTHPTVQMQALLLQPGATTQRILPAPEALYYPLSAAQRRMWVISQLEQGAGYNICGALQMQGHLNIPAFEVAWAQLLQKHEVLRTVYSMHQGQPHQRIVIADERWNISHVDNNTDIEIIYREHEQFSFDLAQGPVVRATLVHGEGSFFFVFSLHHIAADEWTLGILYKELLQLYEANCNNKQASIAPLKIQYRDYAVWENTIDYTQQESYSYWQNAFAGTIPVLDLPVDKPRPALRSYAGASSVIILQGLAAPLQHLCNAGNSTVFMGLVASVHVLLFRYCHQTDLITGIPVSGRDHQQLQHNAGLFLNTLPVRSQLAATDSFNQVLQQVHDKLVAAFAYKDYPFDRLADNLSLQTDLSRSALFDVSIVMHDQAFELQTIEGLLVKPYKGPVSASKFDLSFQFNMHGDDLQLELIYNTDLFDGERIQTILAHYSELLSAAIKYPSQSIARLNYLPVNERQDLNGHKSSVITQENICAQLALQAAKGNAKAVADVNSNLTYAELYSRSGALAHYLRTTYDIQPGDVVALRMERSVNMIVSMLAILKTGAAYLPLDKLFPQQRVDYILNDSNAKLLMADEEFDVNIPVFLPQDEWKSVIMEEHGELLRNHGSIAYIIYTSGTTGNPKGVRITDSSLLHYIAGIKDAYGLQQWPELRGLLASSIAFDLGYTCLWGMLLLGGELHLAPLAEYWDPRQALQQIASEKINFIKLTPSHFRLLLNEALHGEKGGEALQLIVLGGEKIVPSEVKQWMQLFPHCRIANHYGPTETTIGVLTQVINNEEIEGAMPIDIFEKQPVLGRPIGEHIVYIADEQSELCGQGVWGELWINGPGLSPGYVNLESLTAEKFISDPFGPGQRVYRTGDKARLLSNGCIEFAGRIDEQVQLKGYRVEPAEIEQALLKYEGISAAAAMVREVETEQQLIAYIVADAEQDQEQLRSYLSNLLPAYMVPWKIIQLAALPLTPNGKVDRKLLPLPSASPTHKTDKQPSTEAEAALLLAFDTIFKTTNTSITAHFFEAGGDSIKAIQLSSLLYHHGWELEVRAVFQNPVLEEMALQMRLLLDEHPFIHAPAGEHHEVSAAQRRLWFINQLEDNPTVYNMLSALAIEGSFDHDAFANTVKQLVQRHEILRTVFITVKNSPRQKVIAYNEQLHGYEFIDLSAKENRNALLEEIFRADGHVPFNLSEGPLFRLKLVRMQEGLHIFVMNLHHIIYDGWSKTVLEEEFLELFKNLSRNSGFKLPQPIYQYKDYAAWQAKYFSGAAANAHRDYWLEQLKGELPILQFPADRQRPAVKTYASRKLSVTFRAGITDRLHQLAGDESTTDFTVLFSAIQILLKRYSGQDDIITGIPSAGRSRPEVNRMAGLFFNLLPIRTQFAQSETFTSVIKKLAVQMGDAYQHGDYPFDYLVEQLRLQRDLSRSALFDVLVVSQDFGAPPSVVKEENGFAVREVETGFSGNKFDLTFYFRREGKSLSMTIGYNATIFNHERIAKLATHFIILLESLLLHPDNDILSFDYLTRQEVEEMRAGFNNTIRPYPNTKLLHQLFEEAAEKYPTAEALRQNGASVSYEALNRSANIIALRLLSKGVASADNVGILTGRNFSMIQGMLGILKAGAAYVPIDPAYPADRQRYIISNSGIHFIVTDDAAIAEAATAGLENITIIDLDDNEQENFDDVNIVLTKPATDLAYTIYTSGSSGRPKGVMIEHHSAVNLVEWVNTEFSVGSADRMLFITSMCFDLSVYDIFGMLAAGGCIVIATVEDVQDLASIKQLMINERISFWDTVPTTLNYLVTELEHSKEPFVQHHLRLAFLSGDWIPVTLPSLAKKFFPNVRVISLGGATEGTVWSNYFPVDEVDPKWMSIPYGRPITNNFFYILDEALNPVPQGVTGELFIGGVGVSRGYINDAVKTAAAFMDDPFCKDLGGRMYRTGDLGRILPDGNMEFLGRKDFQVKIRGFRVELGEIEQVLSKFPGIQTVLVTASQDNSGIKFLVAYYLGEDHFSKSSLTAFLSRQLPDYMIPAFFIKMDVFPLNTNGKIDRKALPQPLAADTEIAEQLHPRTPTEIAVAGIWSNVLKKELFGVQDNFFMLGGHSLSASQVVARIREELGVPLKLPSIFINPTIEGLSNEIDALKWLRAATEAPVINTKKIII